MSPVASGGFPPITLNSRYFDTNSFTEVHDSALDNGKSVRQVVDKAKTGDLKDTFVNAVNETDSKGNQYFKDSATLKQDLFNAVESAKTSKSDEKFIYIATSNTNVERISLDNPDNLKLLDKFMKHLDAKGNDHFDLTKELKFEHGTFDGVLNFGKAFVEETSSLGKYAGESAVAVATLQCFSDVEAGKLCLEHASSIVQSMLKESGIHMADHEFKALMNSPKVAEILKVSLDKVGKEVFPVIGGLVAIKSGSDSLDSYKHATNDISKTLLYAGARMEVGGGLASMAGTCAVLGSAFTGGAATAGAVGLQEGGHSVATAGAVMCVAGYLMDAVVINMKETAKDNPQKLKEIDNFLKNADNVFAKATSNIAIPGVSLVDVVNTAIKVEESLTGGSSHHDDHAAVKTAEQAVNKSLEHNKVHHEK